VSNPIKPLAALVRLLPEKDALLPQSMILKKPVLGLDPRVGTGFRRGSWLHEKKARVG
jgi:hypothetical protein